MIIHEVNSGVTVTYQRENIFHCEPSPYVKLVTIKSVEPAQNSDFLDQIEFEEMGWNAISKRGTHSVGDQVLFIPPDSILPFELCEALNVTGYTNKGKVRVTKLRGNRSEGLIVDREIAEPYIPYILKWEDPPTVQMRGNGMPQSQVPYDFEKFYKMPNILNEPFTFKRGESIWVSEKIHGTNFRFGLLINPETNEVQDYVGSHNVVLKYDENNLYWQIYDRLFRGKIPIGVVFFAEIYGPGVQTSFHYGLKETTAAIFAIMKRGEYLNPLEVMEYCLAFHLPVVNFHQDIFTDLEDVRKMADEPSEITTAHSREGVVMVSDERPNRMAKCIGFEYLARKKRTERH